MSADAHEIPELDAKGYREFALTTGGIVAGLFGVIIPVLIWLIADRETIPFPSWPHPIASWPWIFFAVLAVWGLAAPTTLRLLYRGWMKFGLLMSTWVMTPVIMFLIFFGMFMPMGLVMRLFGKDLLAKKLDSEAETYRVQSEDPPAKNLEKPF